MTEKEIDARAVMAILDEMQIWWRSDRYKPWISYVHTVDGEEFDATMRCRFASDPANRLTFAGEDSRIAFGRFITGMADDLGLRRLEEEETDYLLLLLHDEIFG